MNKVTVLCYAMLCYAMLCTTYGASSLQWYSRCTASGPEFDAYPVQSLTPTRIQVPFLLLSPRGRYLIPVIEQSDSESPQNPEITAFRDGMNGDDHMGFA
jgi:hypothetical protein